MLKETLVTKWKWGSRSFALHREVFWNTASTKKPLLETPYILLINEFQLEQTSISAEPKQTRLINTFCGIFLRLLTLFCAPDVETWCRGREKTNSRVTKSYRWHSAFWWTNKTIGNVIEAAALQVFSFIGSYKISSVSLITLIETNRNEGDKTHICHFPPSLSLPAIKFRKLNQSNLNNINTPHFSFNNWKELQQRLFISLHSLQEQRFWN